MEIKIEESLKKQNDILLKKVAEQDINRIQPSLIDRVSHQWCDDTFGPEFFRNMSKYFEDDQLAKSLILRTTEPRKFYGNGLILLSKDIESQAFEVIE